MVGLAGVVLAVLIAQVSAAGGSDEVRIDRLERQVRALQQDLGTPTAGTAKKKRRKKGRRGPQGAQGAQGPQGRTGASGPGSGGVQFGWIQTLQLPSPGSSQSYSPTGNAAASAGGAITPNAPVVVRDLAVELNSPPGVGARWSFILQGEAVGLELTCSVLSAVSTSCNSGSQAFTNPPGGSLRLLVLDDGAVPATQSFMQYAYRIGPP